MESAINVSLAMKQSFTREKRKQLIEQWRASGLSKVAFSRENNINESTFYNWTKKYPAHESTPIIKTPSLLPAKSSIVQPASSAPERRMEILINKDCIIRLPMPSTTQAIIELVRGLSSCS